MVGNFQSEYLTYDCNMSLKIKKEKLDLHIKGIESDDRVFKLVSSSAEKKIPVLIDLEPSVTALISNNFCFKKSRKSLSANEWIRFDRIILK